MNELRFLISLQISDHHIEIVAFFFDKQPQSESFSCRVVDQWFLVKIAIINFIFYFDLRKQVFIDMSLFTLFNLVFNVF